MTPPEHAGAAAREKIGAGRAHDTHDLVPA
jgi:hypothetical protein